MKTPFLDTSVLIGGLLDLGASSVSPIAIFDRLASGEFPGACTAWHCCLEFYSVVTRLPEELRLSPEVALQLLEGEVFSRLQIGLLPKSQLRPFLLDAVAARIAGGRVFDAHIAAVAHHMNASVIVTENKRHFAVVEKKHIPVLDAGEFLAQAG